MVLHRIHADVAVGSYLDSPVLSGLEAELRRRINRGWLDRGVTMVDPERTYIDVTVQLGVDVTLFPGTMLQGSTVIVIPLQL